MVVISVQGDPQPFLLILKFPTTICMLCCFADTTKPMYDCAEILLTEVALAFKQIPALIETEGGLRRNTANANEKVR